MSNTVLCKGHAATSNINSNQKTILIVENHDEDGAILKFLLRSFFCRTVVMPTAKAALEYLAEYSTKVILILSEINLPGMSGLEFIEKVRANSKFNRIPIIVQSSEDEIELQKGVLLGASGYVRKPYNTEALYLAISKVIKLTVSPIPILKNPNEKV